MEQKKKALGRGLEQLFDSEVLDFNSFESNILESAKEDDIQLIKLAEAPSHGKTIIDYDPKGKGTKAYLNLAKEVIDRNGTKEESVG